MAYHKITKKLLLKRLLDECAENPDFQVQTSLYTIKNLLCEDSLEYVEISDASDYENLLKLVNYIVNPGLVKDFPEKEERDYDASDFQDVAEFAVNSFTCLMHLIVKLHIDYREQNLLHLVLVPILKLHATHSQIFFWSSSEAVSISEEVIKKVLILTKSADIRSLLLQSSDRHSFTLFKAVLMSIRPMLSKETWTKNPSTCQIFKWLLFHIKHPYLCVYLTDVLPPSLMFIDHHATRNKVLGIKCLCHIVDNVPPTELKMYGRADVVYDALFHLTYLREADIIHDLYPCILTLLSGQERSRDDVNLIRRWSRYDDVYHRLMWNMELEDNIISRREFSSHVSAFIEKLGITVAKHLQRTKRVLLNYLSIFEGPEEISRINALKALETLIKVAWPRMEGHCEDILKSILFLIYDIETDSATTIPQVKETLLNGCKNCLLLLKVACPEKFKVLISSLGEIEDDIPGLRFLLNICE